MPRLSAGNFVYVPLGLEWDRPKPGDLLFDAEDFSKKAKQTRKRAVRARYSRASILLSVAAVEATTNDTLAVLAELLGEACPSECENLEPWVWFRRISYRALQRLVERPASLTRRKLPYVFRLLRRISIETEDYLESLQKRLNWAIMFRNRITHMSYLNQPNLHRSVLNPAQLLHLSQASLDSAREYISLVGGTFEEVNLPVPTIVDSHRPDWWREDDWE